MSFHNLCNGTALGLIRTLDNPSNARVSAQRDSTTPGKIKFSRPAALSPIGRKVKVYIGDNSAGNFSEAQEIAPGQVMETPQTDLEGFLYVRVYVTDMADNVIDSTVVQTLESLNVTKPSSTKALADLNLPVNQAVDITSIPADFTGSSLQFSLAPNSDPLPTGLRLSSDGILSGTPNTLVSGLSIIVQASNSGGIATSGFSLSVVEATEADTFGPLPEITVTAGGSIDPVDIVARAGLPAGTEITADEDYDWFSVRDGKVYIGRAGETFDAPTEFTDVSVLSLTQPVGGARVDTSFSGSYEDYEATNGLNVIQVIKQFSVNGDPVPASTLVAEGDTVEVEVIPLAENGDSATFSYGPVTTLPAPAPDTEPPVLSAFSMNASGAQGATGSLQIDEGSSQVAVVFTKSSTSPSPENVLLGFDENGNNASGGYSVTNVLEAGLVTISAAGLDENTTYYAYAAAKDAAGNVTDSVVTDSFTTLLSSDLRIGVNSFTRDKVPYHSKKVQVNTSGGITEQQLRDMRNDPSIGSQHVGEYKIPGEDDLPEGVSLDPDDGNLTIYSNFTTWLDGWDLRGRQLAWRAGEVRLRNCLIGEEGGRWVQSGYAYVIVYPEATVVEIVNNDIHGPNSYGDIGVAIQYRTNGSGADEYGPSLAPGRIAKNSFFGLTEDGIKPTGGIIEDNLMIWDKNLPGPSYEQDLNKTYNKGDLARNSSNHVFRSVVDGNTAAVPSSKLKKDEVQNGWECLDPHTDAINTRIVTHPLVIRRNLIDLAMDPLAGVGANNVIRDVPNSDDDALHLQTDIYDNLFIHRPGENSYMVQTYENASTVFTPSRFYRNLFECDEGNELYSSSSADGTTWESNYNVNTGNLVPGNPGMITDPTLASSGETTTEILAKVTRSGTASPGQVIEARALSLNDGGATSTDWTEVATTDPSGNWTGTINVPRSPSIFTFEARLRDSVGTVAQANGSFVSGIFAAMHTQSDIAAPFNDKRYGAELVPEPCLADDMVQMFLLLGFEGGGDTLQPDSNLRRVFASGTSFHPHGSASAMAFANTLISAYPDTHIAIVNHSVSGTAPEEMANDGDTGRDFRNDLKVHNFATRDGNQPGLHLNYFSSSYRDTGRWHLKHAPIFVGKTYEGEPYSNPHVYTHFGSDIVVDNTYLDLYDIDFTTCHILPIEANEVDNAIYKLIDAYPDNLKVATFELYNTAIGGYIKDGAHKGAGHYYNQDEQAGLRMLRHWALNFIEADDPDRVGHQPLLNKLEVFNSSTVRVGSTAGPLSTYRKQMGLPELDYGKYPSYAEVFGWWVNATYVKAWIGDDAGNPASEGWIYIEHPTGNFSSGDTIGSHQNGYGRDAVANRPSSGRPGYYDSYTDAIVFSHAGVPTDLHKLGVINAVMPLASGNLYHFDDIQAGVWDGSILR